MFIAATIQFEPEKGKVEKNRTELLHMCEKAIEQGAKLLTLPEMALAGYIWPNQVSIQPHTETAKGPSFRAFSQFCKTHKCYLSYGFAEFDHGRLYNSQNLIDPEGNLITTYRKVHLFFFDELWARPGDLGFQTFDTPLGKMGMGICMDLNFEDFLEFHRTQKTDWLLFATNWVDESSETLEYWRSQLKGFEGTAFMANRFGWEYDIQFSGCSSVYSQGDFTLSAAPIGNQILISNHSNK